MDEPGEEACLPDGQLTPADAFWMEVAENRPATRFVQLQGGETADDQIFPL